MLGEIVGLSANYRLIIDRRFDTCSVKLFPFILSPKTFRASTSFFRSARAETQRGGECETRGIEREEYAILFPIVSEKRGGKFIRRGNGEPFSSLHRAIAVQFFERKEKKEDRLVGGDIVFFFNSISRGRRCELTLLFRTVVNIFDENRSEGNVSFFSHPVGFRVVEENCGSSRSS